MRDPYEVLGVSRSASEAEIKAAYRKLAKQYHPDLHPGDKSCEEKMNEINAAYEAIKNPQPQQSYGGYGGSGASGSSGSSGSSGYYGRYADPFGFGFDPFGGYQQRTQYETRDSTEIQAARNYVNAGAYAEALHVLSTVMPVDRDGQWYYLSARANYGQGNRVAASEHIRRALQLDPDNLNYQRFNQIVQSGGQDYTGTGMNYGFGNNCSVNPCCTALCLLNICTGGRLIFCC